MTTACAQATWEHDVGNAGETITCCTVCGTYEGNPCRRQSPDERKTMTINIKQVQRALQTAGDARMALWNAMGDLEKTLGFEGGNVPDAVDKLMFDATADLAGLLITEEQAIDFAKQVAKLTPEDWPK